MAILQYKKGDFSVLCGKLGAVKCLTEAKEGDIIVALTGFQKEVLQGVADEFGKKVHVLLKSEIDEV